MELEARTPRSSRVAFALTAQHATARLGELQFEPTLQLERVRQSRARDPQASNVVNTSLTAAAQRAGWQARLPPAAAGSQARFLPARPGKRESIALPAGTLRVRPHPRNPAEHGARGSTDLA